MNPRSLPRRIIGCLFCLIFLFQVLQIYRYSRPLNDGTYARVLEQKVLRVGMDASYPPFGLITDDQITGLDADVAHAICARQGWTLQLVQVGYDGLYDALQISTVDVLISALPYDPARGTVFTRSYFDAGQYLVSRQNGLTYTDMADVDGHSVAVEYGSVGDETARLWERRLRKLTIQRFDSTRDALDALRTGAVDTALVDHVSALEYRYANGGVVIAQDAVVSETVHIVTRRASLDLAGSINATLEDMARDGELNRIIARWLP